jgi:hypothetical protein
MKKCKPNIKKNMFVDRIIIDVRREHVNKKLYILVTSSYLANSGYLGLGGSIFDSSKHRLDNRLML